MRICFRLAMGLAFEGREMVTQVNSRWVFTWHKLGPHHERSRLRGRCARLGLPRSRWRTVSTRTTYGDRYGLPVSTGFLGDTTRTGDEACTANG